MSAPQPEPVNRTLKSRTPDVVLREPAHQVSPRAVSYWRLGALIGFVFGLLAAVVPIGIWYAELSWWADVLLCLIPVFLLVHVFVMPTIRYRVHRWEVTDTAIYTKEGWLSIRTEIAPLSRVQTVDTHQSPLMRPFRLASIVVTTASAAGSVSIRGLDEDLARDVVAHLVSVTGASEGDAT